MLAAHALKPVAEHVVLDLFLSQGVWAFYRVTIDVLKVCGGICWEDELVSWLVWLLPKLWFQQGAKSNALRLNGKPCIGTL